MFWILRVFFCEASVSIPNGLFMLFHVKSTFQFPRALHCGPLDSLAEHYLYAFHGYRKSCGLQKHLLYVSCNFQDPITVHAQFMLGCLSRGLIATYMVNVLFLTLVEKSLSWFSSANQVVQGDVDVLLVVTAVVKNHITPMFSPPNLS